MEHGIVYPILVAFIWSLNPAVISRFARDSPPLFFTLLRATFAVIFMITVLMFSSVTNWLSISPVYFVLIIVSGLLGPGLGDAAYTRSIQLIGGSLAITIGYTYIFFAQIISAFLFGEKLGITQVLGALLAFIGIVVATYNFANNNVNYKSHFRSGLALAFSAAVLWGVAASMIKLFRNTVDPVHLSIIRTSSAAFFAGLLSRASKEPWKVTRGLIIATLITGVLGWGIGMVLFTLSIYTIGVSATVVATALAPVLSQVTTRVVAREYVTPRIAAGAALVALGILVHAIMPTP